MFYDKLFFPDITIYDVGAKVKVLCKLVGYPDHGNNCYCLLVITMIYYFSRRSTMMSGCRDDRVVF